MADLAVSHPMNVFLKHHHHAHNHLLRFYLLPPKLLMLTAKQDGNRNTTFHVFDLGVIDIRITFRMIEETKVCVKGNLVSNPDCKATLKSTSINCFVTASERLLMPGTMQIKLFT